MACKIIVNFQVHVFGKARLESLCIYSYNTIISAKPLPACAVGGRLCGKYKQDHSEACKLESQQRVPGNFASRHVFVWDAAARGISARLALNFQRL